jgi:hypothetical protein
MTADYYAECCCDEEGGPQVVLEVVAETALLRVDLPTIEEPVFADTALRDLYRKLATEEDCDLEQALWNAADRACARERVGGWASLSWQSSLKLTGSVHLRATAHDLTIAAD